MPVPHISRTYALGAAVAVAATTIGYLGLLEQQAPSTGQPHASLLTVLQGAPTWLLAVLAAGVVVNAVAVVAPFGVQRQVALRVVAVVLFGAGILGLFSIGYALLLCALLTGLAASRDPGSQAHPARRGWRPRTTRHRPAP